MRRIRNEKGKSGMKEFKILELKRSKHPYAEIEQTLEGCSAQGWEVVSLSVDTGSDLRGIVVILLQRDKR